MNNQINNHKNFYSLNNIKPTHFNFQPRLIKYGQIIYSLRTIFIILPDSFETLKKKNSRIKYLLSY